MEQVEGANACDLQQNAISLTYFDGFSLLIQIVIKLRETLITEGV